MKPPAYIPVPSKLMTKKFLFALPKLGMQIILSQLEELSKDKTTPLLVLPRSLSLLRKDQIAYLDIFLSKRSIAGSDLLPRSDLS